MPRSGSRAVAASLVLSLALGSVTAVAVTAVPATAVAAPAAGPAVAGAATGSGAAAAAPGVGLPREVTPDGGLPGGNQALELFNALVRSVEPPEEEAEADLTVPGELGGGGGGGGKGKAASDLAGTGFGLAGFISGLVLGIGAQKQLDEVLNDLQQIQNTLNTMESQLTAIQASIQQLTTIVEQEFADTNCLTTLNDMIEYTAEIKSAKQDYAVLSSMGSTMFATLNPDGTPNTTVGPKAADLQAFAAHAEELQVALDGINGVLLGGGGSAPALATCAKAAAPQATAALEWEDQYYPALYALVEKEYQLQVTGLDMLLAAYYTRAWLAAYPNAVNQPAGSAVPVTPILPEQLAYICFDEQVRQPNSDVDIACTKAEGAVSAVYGAVQAQLLYAGVPYSWGTNGQVGMLATFANGTPKAQSLWVLDLNDFQAFQPDGVTPCPYPLANSTGNVCGGTVGTSSAFATTTWLGYSGWRPAATYDWLLLLRSNSGTNQTLLGQVMQQVGLEVPGDYVLYTGETSDITNGPALWSQAWKDMTGNTKTTYGYVNAMCLLETGLPVAQSTSTFQPLCDQSGGGTLAYLMNTPLRSTKWSYDGLQFGWNTSIPGTTIGPSGLDLWRFTYYVLGSIFTSTDSGHTEKSGGQYVNESSLTGDPATYQPPGWGSGWNYGPNQKGQQLASPTPTFRWPVISASTLDCSWRDYLLTDLGYPPSNPRTNEAGLPTMCGHDLDAWLAQVLPAPPPTASQQLGDVPDAPARIKANGTTRLLSARARASLSGQPLRVRVTATSLSRSRPVAGSSWRAKRHFSVRRTAKGAVLIRTKGHRNLRITVRYTAPAIRYFSRFTQTYTYRVR